MYIKRQKGWEKHMDFMLLDLLCMGISFYTGYMLRHGTSPIQNMNLLYWRLFGILVIVDLCVVLFGESYKNVVRRGYLIELKETVKHCAIVDALVLAYMFMAKESSLYSRETLIVFYILQNMSMYIVRCLRKHRIRVAMLHNPYTEQMLILTDEKHAESCVRELAQEEYRNYRVIGAVFMDRYIDSVDIGEIAATAEQDIVYMDNIPIVANYDGLSEFLLNNVVDSVFIDADMDMEERQELTNMLVDAGVTVHINLLKLPHKLLDKVVERIGVFTVLTAGMRVATKRQVVLKRAMDILGGIVGCIIMLILGIVVAPAIYIQSAGPILFKQDRVGKNGRTFKIYKFRSMYMNAEERKKELMSQNKMDGLMFKMDDDPRITPIGKFIRKYSIDELPQFINVLKGDMSLVGTRPPTVDEFDQYQLHHRGRLSSKPGITGLWQVSGRSDITDFEEVVDLDTEYIANWSLGGDIRILWRTVIQVLKGDGAE